MNDACTVIVNDDEWFIPCDRMNDIGLSPSGDLIVLTSSSLSLYRDFVENTSNSYPRISCSFGRVCTYQTSNQNTSYLTNASLEIGSRSLTDDFYVSICLGIVAVGVVLWNLFKH